MMALSKWDKISKVEAKDLMERIVFLDVERSSGNWMEMSMNGMDIYKDEAVSASSYYISQPDEFELIGTDIIYSTKNMFPTAAEVLYQLPKAYKHKIDAFRVDLYARCYKDLIEDAYRIPVNFFCS
jgi:hypothetical protein